MKTLPRVDAKRAYLRRASKFVQIEKVISLPFPSNSAFDGNERNTYVEIPLQRLWPTVKPEIILMDYLFDGKHKVNESEAALIAVLLLDLQQDFRSAVKRSVLMNLLR